MFRRFLVLATAGAAAALAACQSDPLSVTNKNAPVVTDLLNSPSGAQTLTSRFFQFAYSGQYGSSDAIWPQTQVLSGENEGTVANFGLLTRGGFPRSAIDNTPNNPIQAGNVRDFSFLTRTSRQASLVINALNQFASSYDAGTAARNRSFAYFTLGYSLGHIALIYDSAAVITPATSIDTLPKFSAASDVMKVALAMLDTAQQIAAAPTATVAIPTTWMSTSSDVTMPRFVQLIRSYKARLRANLPRTPDGVATVDWAQVALDAQNGLNSDFVIQLNQGTNWVAAFLNQALVSAAYQQMPYWAIGMADTTGAYASWVAAANSSKTPFLIRTPDRRFPQGATRTAQNTFVSTTAPPSDTVLYFRNRLPGSDAPGGPTGGSFYDHYRFLGYRTNNLQGPWPLFTRAENDMLAAEGLIRTGNLTAALPLIDRYRTRAGLPRLVGAVTSLDDVVPGGSACVPRFPVRSGTTVTLRCANAFEAMKYEKRLETAFTGYAAWFLDSRRWSDLIVGTPLEWPVPWQETAARGIAKPYQNQRVAATPNTYGWLSQ